MFTGLVEGKGTLRSCVPHAQGARLCITAPWILDGLALGDSVAVNGCCLTVIAFDEESFTVDAVHETLQRTTLQCYAPGHFVNLERPLTPTTRLGGHYVQGHVDGIATIEKIAPFDDGSAEFTLHASESVMKYIVEKGSVALDGVSLTVARLPSPFSFTLALIPHTLEVTTWGEKVEGDSVNVEVDILAKYVEKLLPTTHNRKEEPCLMPM